MSKIPTAEDFLKSKDYNLGGNEELADGLLTNNVIEDMIEFTKLHVEAALKEAKWRCDDVTNSEGLGLYVENSYPLENIK